MGLDMYLFKVKKGDERFIRDNKKCGNYIQLFDYPFLELGPIKDKLIAMIEQATGEKVYTEDIPLPFTVKLPKKRKNKKGYDILGYWRKANSIHSWFINNVQNGIDDGSWYEVSKDNIIDLLDICKTVLKSCEFEEANDCSEKDFSNEMIIDSTIAERLLPTKSGFFWGDLKYGRDYVYDITLSINILEEVLETVDFSKYTVFYNSWS